jgi:hypothetical protein
MGVEGAALDEQGTAKVRRLTRTDSRASSIRRLRLAGQRLRLRLRPRLGLGLGGGGAAGGAEGGIPR